jgi:hypothetical protein
VQEVAQFLAHADDLVLVGGRIVSGRGASKNSSKLNFLFAMLRK